MMNLLAIDVCYTKDNQAHIAGIVFSGIEENLILQEYQVPLSGIAPYESGSFYKRELPCIIKLLEHVTEKIDIIIIDGFVTLGSEDKQIKFHNAEKE